MSAAEREYWELRAEWLKLRGYLFDPNTGLPALPAVVEDVRRRLEDGETIGVLFVDMSAENHLEPIYGWQSYDLLLRQMAKTLQEFRQRVLSPRDVVAVVGVRSDEFLLFVGSRPGQALDERRLARLRDQLAEEISGQLRIEAETELPRAIAISCSGALVEIDPTVRLERSIYQTIDAVRATSQRQRERRHGLRLTELKRILASRDVVVRYQPIVRLHDRGVHGYEALSSGPAGDVFANPEMLFSFAEETDHIVDLERLCRLEAVRGARVGSGERLFINCSAHGFVDPELVSPLLLEEVARVGLDPSLIVFEVTERVAIREWKEFRAILERLRQQGFAVAIDDMGAGYSSLQAVAEIEPDYLKFDISLVRDIHLSPIKRNLLETLVVLADKIHARVIAEGVEQEGEFEALRAMGVAFAQGYYFAPPATFGPATPRAGG